MEPRSFGTVKNPATIRAFGEHLRTLRQQRGLSQQALADEADLSRPTIQRVETGHLCASLDVLASIARALQLPLKDLMDFPEPGAAL
ncbi:helix-turn-helix transcriptional regulator [Hymenobacter sp. GOD-10R]|uniref:helix-turn-helix domain-containing protein n=1 Tax=Hymenobacter sp. GOD-10R TaxID=3093922 RepID=UPI002D79426D|nr:helix-turn-helix transcriptional regulator [Hymenobacter sp. GOD-10R]WRQ31991.1 helix-turn-helix transcriptional regulator [Hymenobacter sp. GOD-10R]